MATMTQKSSMTSRLPQLQNLIKRDPPSYREEFLLQLKHFESELAIFQLRPTKDSDRFTELVTFMSHVSVCYKDDCARIPLALLELLEVHAATLHLEVRSKLFQSLILLRNKGMIDPIILLKLSFKLFSVPDKTLRTSLGDYIFNDIKTININKRNEKLNRGVQAMLFGVVADDTTIAARKTVEILAELYRRRVWTDSRTVNVIASACTSSTTRVVVAALQFFLGIETKMHEDDDEEKKATVKEVDYHAHSKQTKKRLRHVQRQVEHNAKLRRDNEGKASESTPLFPAIQLIHDPQALAEKLFKKLRQPGEKFEVKLLLMNFISRLIGCHKLILLSFYSFLQRYITSHQKDVTHILAYLIQACHEVVPPEDLMPVIKAIAYNFISERCTNEVMSVGINSVREILVRVPALLREPDMGDFIEDLAQYSRKTHKSVMTAAHGIVNLVRELYPTLLKKGDRGKFHDITNIPGQYGEQVVADGVAGADLLDQYERGEIIMDSDDELVWKEDMVEAEEGEDDDWEECSNEDDAEDADDDDDDDEGEEAPDLVDITSTKKKIGKDKTKAPEEEEESEWAYVSASEEERDEELDEEEEEMDDDDEEGWEDMDQDDEEGEDEKEADVVEVEVAEEVDLQSERVSKPVRDVRKRVDATRILTTEDFQLIERLREAQSERARNPKNRTNTAMQKTQDRKRQREEDEEEEAGHGPAFSVNPDSLGAGMKTGKSSKIDRITHILEGRKDTKFEHDGHAGGLTNKEKLRKKNFIMVRKGKKSVNNKSRKAAGLDRHEKNTAKEQFGRDKRKRRRT